jgi:plastocyanin domain-containing protein
VFGSALLGALTVLVPCGISQGMMILAVSSGNALTGALILAAFTIGTSPLFFVVGMTASEFMKRKSFIYVASALVFILGVNSINAGNALRGSAHTLGNYWAILTSVQTNNTTQTQAALNDSGEQQATIEVTSSGYKTNINTLKVNVPVKLTLQSKNAAGCVQVFTIPEYQVKKLIPQNGTDEIVFTPTKTGRLSFSCAMGMYTGSFQVI